MKISRRSFACSCFPIAFLAVSLAWGQTAEMSSKESSVTFKSSTNLVPVPVVVRDSSGHAIGNLAIDDFQLFDNGKPQMISKFTLEKLTVAVYTTIAHPSASARINLPRPPQP